MTVFVLNTFEHKRERVNFLNEHSKHREKTKQKLEKFYKTQYNKLQRD